jgi:Mlc titration factor MtfA (ptsG expression regulator)
MFDIFYNYHEKSHLEDYQNGDVKDTPSSAAKSEIKAFKKAIEAKKKALKGMKERLKNKNCIQ